MDEVTTADIIAFVGLVGLGIANVVQLVMTSRSRGSQANVNDADAIESLIGSVRGLNVDVSTLQAGLNAERKIVRELQLNIESAQWARDIALKRVTELEMKLVALEVRYHKDLTRLEKENETLRAALNLK